MYASTTSDFQSRTNKEKQQHYNNRKQIRYFNIINISECWCEIVCIFEDSVINQSSSTQFLVATFSQMVLFDSWAIWYVFATYEKVCYRISPPRRDSSKCELLRLFFQFHLTKLLKALQIFCIYYILEERPKVLLKVSLIDVSIHGTSSKKK